MKDGLRIFSEAIRFVSSVLRKSLTVLENDSESLIDALEFHDLTVETRSGFCRRFLTQFDDVEDLSLDSFEFGHVRGRSFVSEQRDQRNDFSSRSSCLWVKELSVFQRAQWKLHGG